MDLFKSLATAVIERYQLARAAGLTFDGKRNIGFALGYKDELTYADHKARYERGGIAARIVEAYPKATWRGGAELVENDDPDSETAFEEAFEQLNKRLNVWATLRRADTLGGLSEFAILLIGAAGELDTELPKGNNPDQVLYLTPFAGCGSKLKGDADAKVAEWDMDPASPRFGLPKFYDIKRTVASSALLSRRVHWSRVIHLAEGLLEDEVFGQPVLQSIWNRLDDLDKVTGGGAEAFWLRVNGGVQFDIDKDIPELKQPEVDALKEQVENYEHNISRVLRTRGVKVTQLGSQVADFGNSADAILTQIAGTKGIPKRILMGSEMGQLASGQDADNWDTQVQDRRKDYAEPYVIRALVTRLVDYGYLPAVDEYEVVWPTVEKLTEIEKAQGAAQWASVNATQGETVFTSEEIRDHWYGMEPLAEADKKTPAQKQEEVQQQTVDESQPPNEEDTAAIAALEQAIQDNDLHAVSRIVGLEFNPDQERDEDGKWSSGGGSNITPEAKTHLFDSAKTAGTALYGTGDDDHTGVVFDNTTNVVTVHLDDVPEDPEDEAEDENAMPLVDDFEYQFDPYTGKGKDVSTKEVRKLKPSKDGKVYLYHADAGIRIIDGYKKK